MLAVQRNGLCIQYLSLAADRISLARVFRIHSQFPQAPVLFDVYILPDLRFPS